MAKVDIDMTGDELGFVTFVIENVAEETGVAGDVVYRALTEDSDLLYDYIVPCYDVLHTQGKEYIIRDVLEHLEERGVSL